MATYPDASFPVTTMLPDGSWHGGELAYEVDGTGLDHLRMIDREIPTNIPLGHVLLKIEACSVNFRDLMLISGGKTDLPFIPCSEGVGHVLSAAKDVRRLAVGDRVCPCFFTDQWIDGEKQHHAAAGALGSALPGLLQTHLLVPAEGCVKVPEHLTFLEAATLPCCGVTAWNALMEEGGLRPGQTVLCQGTGGVSLFALQFAKMRGATVIITSSSDEKLKQAKQQYGADHCINYNTGEVVGGTDGGRDYPTNKDWAAQVVACTGGRGVDHVVEVAGQFDQSIKALAYGGRVHVVGGLSNSWQVNVPYSSLIEKNARVSGISAGSRTMFESMVEAINDHGSMRPVVGETFHFVKAKSAFEKLAQGTVFGKICIKMP